MKGKKGVRVKKYGIYIKKACALTALAVMMALQSGCGDPVERMLNELANEANEKQSQGANEADERQPQGANEANEKQSQGADAGKETVQAGEGIPVGENQAKEGTGAEGNSMAEAATMHLQKTEGTVNVTDGAGDGVPVMEQLGLYSGYQVDTKPASYAWIDLDRVKLAKMDAESAIEIQKKEKNLVVNVKSGSFFFNITQPLEPEESMEIRNSNMMVGIRGTCGWVEGKDPKHLAVYILEGTVACSVTGPSGVVTSAEISGGETAELSLSGDGVPEIVLGEISVDQVPGFVVDEVKPDGPLCQKILAESGLDLFNGTDTRGEGPTSELKYRTTSSYDPQTHIRRTMLDSQGYELEVYHEIPVFEETTEGYRAINAFFQKIEDDFFSRESGEVSEIWEMVTDPEALYTPYSDTWSAFINDWNEEYVNVTMSVWWYAGGPHGTYEDKNYTFRVDTGEQLKLTDFIDGTEDEIRGMIISGVQNLEIEEDILYEYIEERPLEEFNFHIKDGQVIVSFAPYEIASWAVGQIDVTLPVKPKPRWN